MAKDLIKDLRKKIEACDLPPYACKTCQLMEKQIIALQKAEGK
jgi:hypothetical protein